MGIEEDGAVLSGGEDPPELARKGSIIDGVSIDVDLPVMPPAHAAHHTARAPTAADP